MARDYLRDRGLADGPTPAVPTTPAWGVDLKTGMVIEPQGDIVRPPEPPPLPDDYNARCLALECGRGALIPLGIDMTMEAIHRFHAFLTATEPAPKEEERKGVFTDG